MIGYARKAGGTKVRLMIDKESFDECAGRLNADGREFVTLEVSIHHLHLVMRGERAVTIIGIQEGEE